MKNKFDVRARVLLKLLNDMPCNIHISKYDEPRAIPDLGALVAGEDDADEKPYQDWLRELDVALGPSQEPGFDLAEFDSPCMPPPKQEGPVWWCVSYDDQTHDDTPVDLAEHTDLVRALLIAKNRLAAERRLRGGA